MRRVVSLRIAPAIAAVALAAPAAADAATRHAATTGAGWACSAASPCALDVAVSGAAAGDQVVVAPGTYAVSAALSPQAAIHLRGDAQRTRPRLVGDPSIAGAVLSMKDGGTVERLRIEATGAGQDAATFQGVVADGLELHSRHGDGAKVVGAPGGTVLRDSVVVSSSSTSSAAGLKLRDGSKGGDVKLRNLTVMASGAATGVRCETAIGESSLVNVLVRGVGADVDASKLGSRCSARHSNLRSAIGLLSLLTGNQQAEPRFVDAAAGDYRPLADSPTVDAGTSDPDLDGFDPDDRARTLGAAPDIGAYEHPSAAAAGPGPLDGAVGDVTSTLDPVVVGGETPDDPDAPVEPGPDGELPPDLVGLPLPREGESVLVAPGAGKVLVRRPGDARPVPLEEAGRVPVGSVVDARAGRMRLVSALDDAGRVQTGTFWGGRFEVRQRDGARGMTALHLRGGSFASCRRGARRVVASASASRKRVVRRLWAKDRGGRFRTHGRSSVATVRGTRWLTEDRCDGTLTRVTAGAVSVRGLGRRATVLVRAGRSHLVRAAR